MFGASIVARIVMAFLGVGTLVGLALYAFTEVQKSNDDAIYAKTDKWIAEATAAFEKDNRVRAEAEAETAQKAAARFVEQAKRDVARAQQEADEEQASRIAADQAATERAQRADAIKRNAETLETRLDDAIGQCAGTLAEKETLDVLVNDLRIELRRVAANPNCRGSAADIKRTCWMLGQYCRNR